MEHQEYESQGLEPTELIFSDNQHVIDCIDKKQFGILSILEV
jgi:myosin heavy subunit